MRLRRIPLKTLKTSRRPPSPTTHQTPAALRSSMLTSARRRAAGPHLRRHQRRRRRRRRHRHLRRRPRRRRRRRLFSSALISESARARVMLRATRALATSPPKNLAVVATRQTDTAPLFLRGRTEKTVTFTVDNSFALTLDCAPWATGTETDPKRADAAVGRESKSETCMGDGRRLHDSLN